MRRSVGLVILGVLLMTMTGDPVAGQVPDEDDSLAALCEAKAPDQALREDCLHLVATVLRAARATTPWEDLKAGLGDLLVPYAATRVHLEHEDIEAFLDEAPIPESAAVVVREDTIKVEFPAMESLLSGRWLPRDPDTGRSLDLGKKKQAKRARVVAGMVADELREFLLSVAPDHCYTGVYGALWGLAAAWDTYADGRGSFDRLVRPALEELGRASSRTSCDPPTWRIELEPPQLPGS